MKHVVRTACSDAMNRRLPRDLAAKDTHLVWLAALICILGIFVFLLPEIARAETEARETPRSRSLQLNEQGVAAAAAQDFATARELLRESLRIDPGNISAAFNLAGIHIAEQQEDSAIDLLEEYQNRAPKDAALAVRLGDAYFSATRLEKALSAYTRALKLNPNQSGVHKKVATIYSLKDDLAGSKRHLEKAIVIDPADPELLGSLAGIKLAEGEIDEAIGHAKRALQISPTPGTYVTLGTAYELQKDRKNSLIAFERARDLGDARPELEAKIRYLQQRQ